MACMGCGKKTATKKAMTKNYSGGGKITVGWADAKTKTKIAMPGKRNNGTTPPLN